MTDYKKMYLTLCGVLAAVLDDIQGKPELTDTFHRLKEAMNRAEDIYIETSDEEDEAADAEVGGT